MLPQAPSTVPRIGWENLKLILKSDVIWKIRRACWRGICETPQSLRDGMELGRGSVNAWLNIFNSSRCGTANMHCHVNQ